jgi:hypothetical protein
MRAGATARAFPTTVIRSCPMHIHEYTIAPLARHEAGDYVAHLQRLDSVALARRFGGHLSREALAERADLAVKRAALIVVARFGAERSPSRSRPRPASAPCHGRALRRTCWQKGRHIWECLRVSSTTHIPRNLYRISRSLSSCPAGVPGRTPMSGAANSTPRAMTSAPKVRCSLCTCAASIRCPTRRHRLLSEGEASPRL